MPPRKYIDSLTPEKREERNAYARVYQKQWRAKNPRYMRNWMRKMGPEKMPEYLRRARGLPMPIRPMPGVCESCKRPEARPGTQRLSLDHCHAGAHFRGWLCNRCNRGLGLLGDNLTELSLMVEYLRQSDQQRNALH